MLQFLEEYLKEKGKDKLYSFSQIDEPPTSIDGSLMGTTITGVCGRTACEDGFGGS